MTIELYDLAGADDRIRFSPYCWRARMALAHKGLSVETVPVRFGEKEKIEFSGQKLVPVIRDGDNVIAAVNPLGPNAGYFLPPISEAIHNAHSAGHISSQMPIGLCRRINWA